MDVVTANISDQGVSVFMNQGAGVFEDAVNLLAGQNPASVVATDVNGDGAFDIVTTTLSDRGFPMLLNLGDGTLQTALASGVARLTTAVAPAITSRDIDLDGDEDLVILQPERDGGTLYIEENSAIAGSFRVTLQSSQELGDLNFGIVDSGDLNQVPTLDLIGDLSIVEDADNQTLKLSGITAGGSESQALRVMTVSGTSGLIPNPVVTYSSSDETGSIQFAPVTDAFGTATIRVTVEDAGLDGDFDLADDNEAITRSFTVTVASNNNGLILPAMTFDAGAGTAAIRYTSTPDLSGSAELTVTVHDPGPDGQLQPGVQDADDGVTTESFTVVVSSVNDPVTGSDESFTVVREDGAVTLDVLANENSANNDVGENLRVLFVTQPSLGGIEIINGGSDVRYTPPGGSVGQTSFDYVVTDGTFTDEATATVTVNSNLAPAGAILVSDFTPGRTGFDASFSEVLDRATLNLYATQSLGPADIVVTGDSVGTIPGSVVVSDDARGMSFVATGGLLAPDTYTVTLRSGADGIVGGGGKQLDGNSDGTAGDNFVTNFTVTALGAETVVASIPDFARGFGQDVNVPADETGIPLTLSRGTGVTGLNLRLTYDQNLLNVTGFVPTISGVFSDFNSGSGLLALSSSTPFTSGHRSTAAGRRRSHSVNPSRSGWTVGRDGHRSDSTRSH